PTMVARAQIRVSLDTKKITGGRTTEESAGQSFSLAYFMMLILYIMKYASENDRSEEHTSELQSRFDLVCRLLLEKKKKKNTIETRCPPQTGTTHHHQSPPGSRKTKCSSSATNKSSPTK